MFKHCLRYRETGYKNVHKAGFEIAKHWLQSESPRAQEWMNHHGIFKQPNPAVKCFLGCFFFFAPDIYFIKQVFGTHFEEELRPSSPKRCSGVFHICTQMPFSKQKPNTLSSPWFGLLVTTAWRKQKHLKMQGGVQVKGVFAQEQLLSSCTPNVESMGYRPNAHDTGSVRHRCSSVCLQRGILQETKDSFP